MKQWLVTSDEWGGEKKSTVGYLCELEFGRMGRDAFGPATVVHSRTYHRLTRPLVT